MIPTIKVNSKQRVTSATSSKGCQPKWLIDNIWYKADSVGFESFAEVASSRIAHMLNMNIPIVDYELCYISLPTETKLGCSSKSFLQSDDIEITAQRKLEALLGRTVCDYLSAEDKVKCLISYRSQLADELSCLFQFDRLIKNGDRHFHNIVFKNNELVLFDNGDGCTSDITYDYQAGKSVEECLDVSSAKPFLRSFDETCEIMTKYSSFKLEALTDTIILSDLKDYVPDWFYSRVVSVLKYQFKKYLNVNLVVI